MREAAVVVVDRLNVHRVPGDRKEDIVGDLKRGDRFDVIERRSGAKVQWLRKGANEWVAECNTVTGERFCNTSKISERPDLSPLKPFPVPPAPFGWKVPAIVTAVVIGLLTLIYSCSWPA